MSIRVSTLPVCKKRLWLASPSGCMQVSVLVDSATVGGLKEVFLGVKPHVQIYLRLQGWS